MKFDPPAFQNIPPPHVYSSRLSLTAEHFDTLSLRPFEHLPRYSAANRTLLIRNRKERRPTSVQFAGDTLSAAHAARPGRIGSEV